MQIMRRGGIIRPGLIDLGYSGSKTIRLSYTAFEAVSR